MTVSRTRRFSVPNEFMIPIGAEATRALKSCADTWNDSQMQVLRAKLPVQYHAVPVDELRMQFINLRKKGTPGFKLNGHGPSKAEPAHPWYLEYLQSDHWKVFRRKVLDWWEHRCSICNGVEKLDVHHRTYDRIGSEQLNDCVCLCRKCHKMFHRRLAVMPPNRPTPRLSESRVKELFEDEMNEILM